MKPKCPWGVAYIGNELSKASVILAAAKEYYIKHPDKYEKLNTIAPISFIKLNFHFDFKPVLTSHKIQFTIPHQKEKCDDINLTCLKKNDFLSKILNYRTNEYKGSLNRVATKEEEEVHLRNQSLKLQRSFEEKLITDNKVPIKKNQRFTKNHERLKNDDRYYHYIDVTIPILVKSYNKYLEWSDEMRGNPSKLASFICFSNNNCYTLEK